MGIHPFAGSFNKPYDMANNLAQKIEHHLFVHNQNISAYKRSVPPPHQAFHGLSDGLQDLFLEAFVKGGQHPELRPTAHLWCSAIMQHLDIHRFRILPSKLIKLPEHQIIYQPNPAPSLLVEQLKQKASPVSKKEVISPKILASRLVLFLRKINFAILTFGLTYSCSNLFFQNNLPLNYLILFTTICSSIAIILFSFLTRQNNLRAYLVKISLSENLHFFQKQEQIVKGIQEHLEQFWKQLNQEQRKFFPKISKDHNNNIQIAIEDESNRLQEDLQLKDKTAKDLIQSEIFEYTTLKEKYNRVLRTNSHFVTATSLDAELSAIDFALQESLEDLQKTLGKELKSTQLEYDLQVEKDARILQNLERSVQRKIGQFRKKMIQAKKQEEKKMLLKMQRQIRKDGGNVANNIATRVTLFNDEIKRFLRQHGIQNIRQIKEITPPGIVTLKGGKKVSIAPLKYYQIHELLEWWMAVKLGSIELSDALKEQINKRYEKQLSTYKKKLQTDLKKATTGTIERKETIQKEATIVLKNLRSQNEPQVLALKETYRQQKEFLNQIFDERNLEEAEIHERYQAKFDALIEATQKRADATQKFIQNLYQANPIPPKSMAAYKKNQAKYELGLQRLKEEYHRLSISHARYKKAKMQAKKYHEIDLWIHLQQMFFLKPIS